jgi:hypothetical protein
MRRPLAAERRKAAQWLLLEEKLSPQVTDEV